MVSGKTTWLYFCLRMLLDKKYLVFLYEPEVNELYLFLHLSGDHPEVYLYHNLAELNRSGWLAAVVKNLQDVLGSECPEIIFLVNRQKHKDNIPEYIRTLPGQILVYTTSLSGMSFLESLTQSSSKVFWQRTWNESEMKQA